MANAELTDNARLERLMAACAAGDRQAFAEIYAATSPKFYSILLKMVGCEETAKDILQKGYLAVWSNAAKFDPSKAKAFTWMLVIMRNKGIDSLRSARWTRQIDEINETVVDEAPRPHAQAEISQAGRMLESRLAALPPKVSQAVLLHVVHGYSCKEIGERFEASPNTVKSWIRRGLERLRSEMPYDNFAAAL